MHGPSITVAQAYATLGLEEGADIDAVKKAYKARALSSHPDKNPDRRDEATEEFKTVGAAYERITKHLEGPSMDDFGSPFGGGGGGPSFHFHGGGFYFNPGFGFGGGGGARRGGGFSGMDDYYDDDDDDDYYYGDDDDDEDDYDFFR